MADTAAKPRPWWLGAIFVAAGIAILLTFGTWQVQRLRWKEGLLARVAAAQAAPATPLKTVLGRPTGELDFVRVEVECPQIRQSLALYSVREGDAGVRLIGACQAFGKVLLVDTGFIRTDSALSFDQGSSPQKALGRVEAAPVREPLVGVLRVPSAKNLFTPANQPAEGAWYWMDIPAMSAVLAPGRPQSWPVILMLEHPKVSAATPAPLPTEISNRHLEYALTWYGLAATLAGVYIALLLRRRSSKT